MTQMGFYFDQTRCTGCYACVVACKDWHDIDAGPVSWMRVNTIEKGKFLDGETISKLWMESRDMIYGDAMEWLPEMKWWWTMKLHFYIPNYRYYNYPYVYAQLFVYAMYRLYKEQGKEFVPKLKALLGAGSSKAPRELAAEIGFDITKEDFWQKGIDQFAEFIEMFEKTL